VLLAVAALLATGLPAAAEQPDPLAARLSAALSHPGLRGARLGALVVRASDGRTIFDRNADELLVPASNLKVLTAVAALAAFGPAHRFTTEVLADAPPAADGAVGTLAVRGGGDPRSPRKSGGGSPPTCTAAACAACAAS
jgi:D-alanyl-D-alanine carboxypeptidase/D-alanyl-D-alanine-endopeptidase (penicillin-binding protein 4)